MKENKKKIPETVVENCPETVEVKMKRGYLAVVKLNELGPSGQPYINTRDCGGELPRDW